MSQYTYLLPYLHKALLFLSIMVGFAIIAGIFQRLLNRWLHKRSKDKHLFVLLVAGGCKWFILGLGLLTALGTIGVNVSAMVASLGLTGFGLGFALKDSLSSAMTGLMVMINRPFVIGDAITIGDHSGKVVGINSSYITLMTAKQAKILVPNAVIFKEMIEVKSKPV